jgi:predicted metal-dependent phosphoesterase TrpH
MAFADLHCHSSASFDSLSAPSALVRAAARIGLTHLAITDHERLDGAFRARDAAPQAVTVIIGEEIRTAAGDMIGLFLERPVPPGLGAVETAAAIHEQGGLAGLPHPFDRFRSSGARMAEAVELAELAQAVDYVEVHNARALWGSNAKAARFAVDRGLPGIAASDAHSLIEVGVAYTILQGPLASAADLAGALPGARLVIGRASFVARAMTPAAKLVQRARGNRRIRPGADARPMGLG